ncbi:hypothetical protein GCM10027176_79400 [Actinoallomurus bryophytorum]|uniref:Uncharacterized protein n=1 Tax=Actinoallomurus bryophytorum TaxID=1490222 RepID=A0A543C0Q1_9ACTN|nr:hypothetical protein [Actinoallomurus bryophytorum]TQL90654.1 hypothetical protein FB559_7965 [Actinoallomurus bryophytorum]
MEDALDALEHRIAQLRQAVREAVAQREAGRAKELRAELRRAERAWDALISPPEVDESEDDAAPDATGRGRSVATSMLPVREQVHQALTLLGVPAAPKLVGAVHEAFFTGTLPTSRLTSLRRDEERSYRSAPGARPYYLCPALTYDHLAPARALLTVSTWPMEDRVVGPLSPRVHFLSAAISIAGAVTTLPAVAETGEHGAAGAERLLQQFAVNIPGATTAAPSKDMRGVDPHLVRAAAKAELDVHYDADRDTRVATARRARRQMDDAEQLFGTRLKTIRGVARQG